MFWNKVEEVKPKKNFVIGNRILALNNKIELINNTIKDSNAFTDDVYVGDGNYVYYKGYKIDTIYGKREIIIINGKELYYGEPKVLKKEKSYSYYIDPYYISKYLFAIKVRDVEVVISPYPMVKFTSQEIDLAILEFENAIEPLYQEALIKEGKHKACVDYFSEVEDDE